MVLRSGQCGDLALVAELSLGEGPDSLARDASPRRFRLRILGERVPQSLRLFRRRRLEHGPAIPFLVCHCCEQAFVCDTSRRQAYLHRRDDVVQ